jgi:hypothetical protein
MRKAMGAVLLLVLQGCGSETGAGTETGLSAEERAYSLQRGETIVQATFATLSGRLHQAMAEGGPAHAVEYCRIAAAHMTDSMGAVHAARVKRTSDRVRSPANAPDAHEQIMLDAILEHLRSGGSTDGLEAEVFALGDSIAYYKPILIASPLCLACHGAPGAGLDSNAFAEVGRRYPADQAYGYREVGQFRGLWSVRWTR